jgi:hypothetical protein
MSPPGDETRTLIGNIEERAKVAREHQAELDEAHRKAQREKDMRTLLYVVLAAAIVGLGTVATFWDDLVRNEVRLEQLEKYRPPPPPEKG